MSAISNMNVHSREDFVRFVRELSETVLMFNPDNLNRTVDTYLEAVSAYAADIDGYFANINEPVPEPSWALFALILRAATIYE